MLEVENELFTLFIRLNALSGIGGVQTGHSGPGGREGGVPSLNALSGIGGVQTP